MSVDVEDYFQVWAFNESVRRQNWDDFPSRVCANTKHSLDLFRRHGVKATFFFLGWVAERFPALVREVAAEGHEIASHGYDHTKIYEQNQHQFFDDVKRTKDLLENLAEQSVIGYRAPGFSISRETPWAYDVLARTGHRYSSSVHPISHDHYGDPRASQTPIVRNDCILEAPVATARAFGRRFSCAGGGWFRALPKRLFLGLMDRAVIQGVDPIIFYFHPWELDPDQPRINAPIKSRIRHYLNLGSTNERLSKILDRYPWGRIDDALSQSHGLVR